MIHPASSNEPNKSTSDRSALPRLVDTETSFGLPREIRSSGSLLFVSSEEGFTGKNREDTGGLTKRLIVKAKTMFSGRDATLGRKRCDGLLVVMVRFGGRVVTDSLETPLEIVRKIIGL